MKHDCVLTFITQKRRFNEIVQCSVLSCYITRTIDNNYYVIELNFLLNLNAKKLKKLIKNKFYITSKL